MTSTGNEPSKKVLKKEKISIKGMPTHNSETTQINQTRKNGTQTSSFGVSARTNHDSSKFYNSKLYKELNSKEKETYEIENKIPLEKLDKIFCSSGD